MGHRVFKEHEIYGNEVVENKIKLDKLRAEGEEDWGVRNAVRASLASSERPVSMLTWDDVQAKLLEESKKMVVNTDQRLRKAIEDLRDVIVCPYPLHLPFEFQRSCLFFPGLGQERPCIRRGRRIDESRRDFRDS